MDSLSQSAFATISSISFISLLRVIFLSVHQLPACLVCVDGAEESKTLGKFREKGMGVKHGVIGIIHVWSNAHPADVLEVVETVLENFWNGRFEQLDNQSPDKAFLLFCPI